MSGLRWRDKSGRFPWNDLDTPLQLFVSPALYKALNLPSTVRTTDEYLEEIRREKAFDRDAAGSKHA